MTEQQREFGPALKDLGAHPNDPKIQLRFAFGLYAISDLGELLSTVIDGILTVTGMERGYLMLKENGDLTFPVARDKKKRDLDLEQFSFSHTIVDQVLGTQDSLFARCDTPPKHF